MIMEKAIELTKMRKTFVMATIIDAKGSVPGKSGSKLIYTQDHQLFGTVGGGLVEAEVIKEAKELLEHKENKVLEYNLTKSEKGIGMNCGGSVKVFLEFFAPQARLLLFGGGHIGYAIAQLAQHLNMEITLVEERPEFASKERFPQVVNRVVKSNYKEAFREIKIDEQTYVVIVTKGSSTDEVVLEEVIHHPVAYIGMMGSKRKKIEIMKNMKNKGYREEVLEKIYCPIGLDLRADSPEEIAVSVIAELVAVKNRGTAKHLKEIDKKENVDDYEQ